MNPYEDYKIYGPYVRKDGRQHVCLVHRTTMEKKTVSYPKFIMECHIGRILIDDETVDHIDRDFTNNELANLRVIARAEHVSQDSKRLKSIEVECVFCGEKFVIEGKKIKSRSKKKSGPFCSRRCSGKYGTDIQNDRINRFEPSSIKREYYYIEKE